MSTAPKSRLAQVTGRDVAIDPAVHYDGWANSYNKELIETYGYCAHKIAVRHFAYEFTDSDLPIIDVGCGTGLVGQELAKAGYTVIDGVDISDKMLAHAKETGVYRHLMSENVERLGNRLQGQSKALICVGSFGIGYLGPSVLEDLIKMVHPNGLIQIFMNAEPFEVEDYQSRIAALQQRGLWTVQQIEDHNYMTELTRPGKLIVAGRE